MLGALEKYLIPSARGITIVGLMKKLQLRGMKKHPPLRNGKMSGCLKKRPSPSVRVTTIVVPMEMPQLRGLKKHLLSFMRVKL